jgi:hypothetical protein
MSARFNASLNAESGQPSLFVLGRKRVPQFRRFVDQGLRGRDPMTLSNGRMSKVAQSWNKSERYGEPDKTAGSSLREDPERKGEVDDPHEDYDIQLARNFHDGGNRNRLDEDGGAGSSSGVRNK